MTQNELVKLAERAAFVLSSSRVKDCVRSLRAGEDWIVLPSGEAHRTKPYPMGFYPSDPNLYYAIGWGCHEYMFPHERWLVHRARATTTGEGK